MLRITPIPAFNDNYIWALYPDDASDNSCILVDPGSAEAAETWLSDQNKTLTAILLTHHHNDHTGGVKVLHETYECPVYGPANSPFDGITQPLHEGDLVYLLDTDFEIKEVPAHTLDHISYYSPSAQILLCGDTLFMAGCGRLFEGTAEQMHKALNYFATLPDDTSVYCTHEYTLSNLAFALSVEPDNADIKMMLEKCISLRDASIPTLPSKIGLEKAINPFMRTLHPSVVHAATRHQDKVLNSPVEVLAALREWKNNF
jgi:hydroxyacylglutathione hydrolase